MILLKYASSCDYALLGITEVKANQHPGGTKSNVPTITAWGKNSYNSNNIISSKTSYSSLLIRSVLQKRSEEIWRLATER